MRWVDALGRPAPDDESKASGAERELDAKGRVIAMRYVDATGAPATRADGVSTVRYRYGTNGVEEESYFTREGVPETNDKGIHRIAIELSAKGLDLSRRFLDDHAQPAPRKDGVQSLRESYDDYGNLLEERTFDVAGRLHAGEDKPLIGLWLAQHLKPYTQALNRERASGSRSQYRCRSHTSGLPHVACTLCSALSSAPRKRPAANGRDFVAERQRVFTVERRHLGRSSAPLLRDSTSGVAPCCAPLPALLSHQGSGGVHDRRRARLSPAASLPSRPPSARSRTAT